MNAHAVTHVPLLALLLAAAGAAHAQQPAAGAAAGSRLFVEKCGMCHGPAGMGTALLARRPNGGDGLLESRRDLNAPLVQVAVRQGILNMPRLSRAEVSDAALAEIAAYLVQERRP